MITQIDSTSLSDRIRRGLDSLCEQAGNSAAAPALGSLAVLGGVACLGTVAAAAFNVAPGEVAPALGLLASAGAMGAGLVGTGVAMLRGHHQVSERNLSALRQSLDQFRLNCLPGVDGPTDPALAHPTIP